jgi:hypothetical protein
MNALPRRHRCTLPGLRRRAVGAARQSPAADFASRSNGLKSVQPAATGHRDQPSRCGLICNDAVCGLGARIRRMIKRILIAALAVAAPVCLVSAQDAKVSVDMIGIGRMSCAHWRSTQAHRLEGTIWIYGFWTGLNYVAAASDQTQAKIDEAAIAAQVEKTCAQQSSQPLASAAWTTYLESKR